MSVLLMCHSKVNIWHFQFLLMFFFFIYLLTNDPMHLQRFAQRVRYPSVPRNLLHLLPFFGGGGQVLRSSYMIKKWRPTFISFHISACKITDSSERISETAFSKIMSPFKTSQDLYASLFSQASGASNDKQPINAASGDQLSGYTFMRARLFWFEQEKNATRKQSIHTGGSYSKSNQQNASASPINQPLGKSLGHIDLDYTTKVKSHIIKVRTALWILCIDSPDEHHHCCRIWNSSTKRQGGIK